MAVDRIPVAHIKATQANLVVNTSSWTEAKVGSTALGERKWVQIFNRSYYNVWYSYDSSLSASNSFVLKSGAMLLLPLSDAIPVYLKGVKGLQRVIVAEVA